MTSDATADTYCDFGDLPASQCACHHCRPDITAITLDGNLTIIPGTGHHLDEPENVQIVSTFEATYRTRCDGDCGTTIHPGDLINRTQEGDKICSGCAA